MTDKEINDEIAKHFGWKPHELLCEEADPHGYSAFGNYRPDFCNDMNAIHGAVESLCTEDQVLFAEELVKMEDDGLPLDNRPYAALAGPRRRCEALLRAMGKWRDA